MLLAPGMLELILEPTGLTTVLFGYTMLVYVVTRDGGVYAENEDVLELVEAPPDHG